MQIAMQQVIVLLIVQRNYVPRRFGRNSRKLIWKHVNVYIYVKKSQTTAIEHTKYRNKKRSTKTKGLV